jgi:hypothetical protein
MLSECSGNKIIYVKLNINAMNFYKHEIVTSYKHFLCKTVGEIFVN